MGSPKLARAWKPGNRKINLVTSIKGMGAVKKHSPVQRNARSVMVARLSRKLSINI